MNCNFLYLFLNFYLGLTTLCHLTPTKPRPTFPGLTLPQFLQWCRRRTKVKATLHDVQIVVWLSGIHAGPWPIRKMHALHIQVSCYIIVIIREVGLWNKRLSFYLIAAGDATWRHRSESTLAQAMAWWWHQAITWTNVDLSSVRSSNNHLRANLQETSQPSITKISLEITFLKFNLNLTEANESNQFWGIQSYPLIMVKTGSAPVICIVLGDI